MKVVLKQMMATAEHRDSFTREIDLPFPPFPGLVLKGMLPEKVVVEYAEYDVNTRTWYCAMKPLAGGPEFGPDWQKTVKQS
jgi:hypothetical protein